MNVPQPSQDIRTSLLRRGLWLNGILIAWNVVEGIVAVTFGLLANSVALIGFGIDSGIEVSSSLIVFRRLLVELRGLSPHEVERNERIAGRLAGALLLMLAAYISVDAGRRFLGYGGEAKESVPGIVLTGISLVVMPVIGVAKLRIAARLQSRALRADAYENIACAWLSLATLGGLALNLAWGWRWADPVAALLIVPLILREGLEAMRGDECGRQ